VSGLGTRHPARVPELDPFEPAHRQAIELGSKVGALMAWASKANWDGGRRRSGHQRCTCSQDEEVLATLDHAVDDYVTNARLGAAA
jgi:hypothetical protein